MSTNLLNLFKDQLSGEVLGSVSSLLGGENNDNIQKGLMAAAPALLGGIMDKASTSEGASSIFNMLGDGSELGNIASSLTGSNSEGALNKGLDLVKNILGDKASGVIDLVGSVSGMGSDSSSSVLSVAGSLLGGVLGQQKSSGMDLGSFVGLLSNQGSFLDKFAPAGLSALLGLASFSGISDKLGSLASGALGFAGNVGGAALDGAGKVAGAAAGIAGNVGGAALDGAGKVAGAAAGLAGNVGGAALDGAGKVAGAAAGLAGNVGGAALDGAGKVAGAAAGLAGSAGKAGTSLVKKILPWAIGILGLLFAFFFIKGCDTDKSLLDNVKNAANSTTTVAGDAVSATGNAAGNVVDATGNAVGNVAGGIVDAAGNAVDATGNAVGNVAGGIVDAAGNVVDATGNVAGGILDASGKMVNAFGEAIGNFFSFKLPNGTALNIPEGGFEDNFLNYIKDGKFESGKHYAFDRLYFNTGSASLDTNSLNQISNVAAIMKAYPEVKVLFRGHTDNTGSVAGNNNLSAKRALSVKNKLVEMGVAASRINTKGLGSVEPIADNSTAEGRSKNRRIDVSVL